MNNLVIVNTQTGQKVRPVGIRADGKRGGTRVAYWSDGNDQHAARAGLVHDGERVVAVVEGEPTGTGALTRETGQAWDGADAWVISREHYDRPASEIGNEKKATVDAERDRRRYPGDVDTGLGWPVDLRDGRDEANIAGKVMRALSIKADAGTEMIDFIGADNATHNLTADEMILVGKACDDMISANSAAARAIKDDIDAAVAAVEDAEAGGDPDTIEAARDALDDIDPVDSW